MGNHPSDSTAIFIKGMGKLPYRERTYRNRLSTPGLASFQVSVRETDLFIAAQHDLSAAALSSIHRHRRFIENYIALFPEFLRTLTPMPEDRMAPEIVQKMLSAAAAAKVGPMAAVAGAVAESVGRDLLQSTPEVIIENGGDIFLACHRDIHIRIFAGQSPLSDKLILNIASDKMPLGVCTSSGTVGPSFSFGRADAVCVISPSTSLADAAASQIGNRIKSKNDIEQALDAGSKIPGVKGLLIIVDDHLGAWGDIVLL